MPWLLHAGSRIQVAEGETVVGGGERADARVTDSELAPRHFVVALDRGGATVRACSVDAVVTLNGEPLDAEPCPLSHGDSIAAGRGWFLYLERDDPAAAARPIRPSKLAGAPDAWLVDVARGLAWSLAGQVVGIGRDPSNAVALAAATASRFHAHVRREAGAIVLHPAGSAGTWLNGSRLGTPALLAEGDEIEIAGTWLLVASGALPAGVRIAPVADPSEATRRPTVERMTPLPVDATRRSPPARLGLVVALVLAAVVLSWLFAR